MTSIVLTSQNPQRVANPLEQYSTDVSQDKKANSRPIRFTPNVSKAKQREKMGQTDIALQLDLPLRRGHSSESHFCFAGEGHKGQFLLSGNCLVHNDILH